jgi:fructose-bisphosphate aldolase class II
VTTQASQTGVRHAGRPTQEIIGRAFAERYGVAAINVVNDLTMEAVLAAAEDLKSPIILQTSVKHVLMTGVDLMYAMWIELTRSISVPAALHLDHCPDRSVISACLARGWNSVLFDASKLSVEENKRQCIEVVAEARAAAQVRVRSRLKRTEDVVGDEARTYSRSRRSSTSWAQPASTSLPGHRQRHGRTRRPHVTPSGSPTSSRRRASRWPSTAAPA